MMMLLVSIGAMLITDMDSVLVTKAVEYNTPQISVLIVCLFIELQS